MKKILVIDGGGVKGVVPAVVLSELERATGRTISESFDLIIGTSVGAILGGILATGRITAEKTLQAMQGAIPRMFKRRPWPLLPKYRRDALDYTWAGLIGTQYTMAEARARFMCTAVNMCTSRTHYFKSWETKDGALRLIDAVSRSYAAPMYFGKIIDETASAVWIDGGSGEDNCPLIEALIETLRQGWLGHGPVGILSLGCGTVDASIEFSEAKKCRSIGEVLYYADPKDGGLARNQSVPRAVAAARAIDGLVPDLVFSRINAPIARELDVMDGVRYMGEYAKIGALLGSRLRTDAPWLF